MIRSLFKISFGQTSARKGKSNPAANAVVKNASETSFRQSVENHLSNNRSGTAYLSKGVHHELRDRNQSNINELARRDPVAEARYLVAMASLNYDGQARMAAAVYTSQQAVGRIYAAHEHADSFSADLKAITDNTDLDEQTRAQKITEAMQSYADKVG